MNTCMHWEKMLSRKIDGDLSADEQASLSTHLLSCSRCRKKQSSYEKLRGTLSSHTIGASHEIYSAIAGSTGLRDLRIRIAAAAAALLVIAGASSLPFLMRSTITVTTVNGIDAVDYHLTRFIQAGSSDITDKSIEYVPLESFVAFTSR